MRAAMTLLWSPRQKRPIINQSGGEYQNKKKSTQIVSGFKVVFENVR